MSDHLPARAVHAWMAPRASLIAERANGEGRLLAYAFGAAFFLTLGPILAEAAAPTAQSAEDRTGWVAARLFTGLSFGVLALYGVAALLNLGARLFGGASDGVGARAALFWSGFASGPVAVLAHVGGAAAGASEWGGIAGGLLWCALLAPMTSAVYDFSRLRVATVFAAIAIAAFALKALA